MPRVSAFNGIAIWIYYDEPRHRGRPHFHAHHGDARASIDIERPAIITGGLSWQAERLVLAWAGTRQAKLRENWARAARHEPLAPVDPPP